MPDLKENEFKCAMCGGIFEKEFFDDTPFEQYDPVCDECFKKVLARLTGTLEASE